MRWIDYIFMDAAHKRSPHLLTKNEFCTMDVQGVLGLGLVLFPNDGRKYFKENQKSTENIPWKPEILITVVSSGSSSNDGWGTLVYHSFIWTLEEHKRIVDECITTWPAPGWGQHWWVRFACDAVISPYDKFSFCCPFKYVLICCGIMSW